MRLTHDKTTGSFYLKLRNMGILKTKPLLFLSRRILLDLSSDGRVVGIEYLHKSFSKSPSLSYQLNLLKLKSMYQNAYHMARASLRALIHPFL